jgi:nucleotide-binding universal stress UspA family protein
MEEHILVAVDGSEHALEAVKEAVKLARAMHCKLTVVNVQLSFKTIHTKLYIKEDVIRDYQRELFENATKTAVEYLQSQGVDYELKMLVGDPVQQISKAAKELEASYIVMGSRGMGLVKGAVLGSVSNGIIYEAKVPVLIIPKKK